jgi:hypothetical protein
MEQRAFIYWNLHRDCYSVRGCRSGRVFAHADGVRVTDAVLAVSEAGRQRVLRERSKNVHAGVRGTVEVNPASVDLRGWTRITYNPYKYETFVRASDERPVIGADDVQMVIRDGRPRVYAKGLRFAAEKAQAA